MIGFESKWLNNYIAKSKIQTQMKQKHIYLLRSIIFIGFGLSILCTSAQDKPSFVGLRTGVSIPFSKYAAKDLDEGSFTQAGFNVAIDGAWFFKPKFGVGGAVGLNLLPVDVASLGRARVDKDPFLSSVVIRSEPWKIIIAMIGPYFQFPISSKFSFSAKLLGGLLYGKTPYQLYKPDYYLLPDDWAEITPATDMKFSWQTGIGIVYNLNTCIDLALDADLFYDKLAFGFNSSTGYYTDERTIAMINTTLGLRINL